MIVPAENSIDRLSNRLMFLFVDGCILDSLNMVFLVSFCPKSTGLNVKYQVIFAGGIALSGVT